MCAGDDDSAGAGSPQILDVLDVIPNIGMRMALVCAIIFFTRGGFNDIAISLARSDGNRIYVTVVCL